jgi:hypothetical protein
MLDAIALLLNVKSTDAAHVLVGISISRPRRQMPAYHHQYQFQQNSHKHYVTMLLPPMPLCSLWQITT